MAIVMNHALRAGLIFGLIEIILTLVIYFIDRSYFASFLFGLTIILLLIMYPIFTVINLRKQNEGFIDFKSAFTSSFFTCFNAAILSAIFTYILYNFMDPELGAFLKEKAVEKATSMMERFNVPQEDIDKQIEQLENQPLDYGIAANLKALFFKGFFIGIYSLILAAILKKKQPEPGF